MTPRILEPAKYRGLLNYGIGLTDLVKHKAGTDDKLDDGDFEAGWRRLAEQLRTYQPLYLVFNGKRAANQYFGKSRIAFGLQEERIGETSLFVAPSTSGAAARWWDIGYWQELAKLAECESDL